MLYLFPQIVKGEEDSWFTTGSSGSKRRRPEPHIAQDGVDDDNTELIETIRELREELHSKDQEVARERETRRVIAERVRITLIMPYSREK